jgi:isochorismate pyruvate lyase
MQKAAECKNLDEIRNGIYFIDNQIVKLISERAEYVKEAAKFKKSEQSVRDEKRVALVIESKKQLALKYNISPELIGDLYQRMIDFFVQQELNEWRKS